MAEVEGGEILDLVTGDHHAFVEQVAIRAEPLLEGDDASILEQTQELALLTCP